jgi:hypothetical protein
LQFGYKVYCNYAMVLATICDCCFSLFYSNLLCIFHIYTEFFSYFLCLVFPADVVCG